MTSRTPHRASCLLTIQVFDKEKGVPVSHSDLAAYNLKPKMVLEITGDTKEICLQRLKEAVDAFNR